jgi:hypothetical protein
LEIDDRILLEWCWTIVMLGAEKWMGEKIIIKSGKYTVAMVAVSVILD